MSNEHSRNDAKKVSKVEQAKAQSNHLRGTIAQTLSDPSVDHFVEDDLVCLKFHGVYQQDDRDTRIERRKAGRDKAYSFLIRIAVPAGVCTAEQYLEIDRLGQVYGNGGLRLTTRQAFQLHGVIKGELHDTMNLINKTLLTTLAACGDIPRNVMASPAPYSTPAHVQARALAKQLAQELAPATKAYHEIWIDGEKIELAENEEPFYGETYLPRKFKLGVALDTDNSIDAYADDASLIGIVEDDEIIGYNLLVGGGFGMTNNKPDTIARVATRIGFVPTERAIEAMRGVIAVFRDAGNRESRRHSRLKYLLDDWGVDRFRSELESVLEWTLEPARPTRRPRQLDHLGHHAQGDGLSFLGVWVPNGRVTDTETARYASAFREIVRSLSPRVVLTPMQSIIFGDLTESQVARAQEMLKAHGVALVEEITNIRRYSMACPALPTCGLALAESERVQPALIDSFEKEIERLGLNDTEIIVRMTGCPNGCARPYNADIGIVGRRPGVYDIFVGGGISGDRLADLFDTNVPFAEIVAHLRPLLERFGDEREPNESLSDFYRRAISTFHPTRTRLTGKEEPTSSIYSLKVVT